ncbi:MAG: two-component system sensor histidine kinase NtrB, partial [Bdellovibrionota bacterium]
TRELEKKMRTNEKLASLGEFAAGLAHEIKNPLASVSGSIQMLQGSDSTEDQKFRLMSIIMRETDRLDRLLNDFLNYAKPGQLKLEELSIAEIASEVAALIKNQEQSKEIRFELQMNKDLKIEADPIKVRQLIWNLLKNAVDAIHQRGEIVIRLSDLGEKVRLEIQDSGCGMEKEIQDHVFQPFFTRSQNGTGLGLALVHQVVKEHQGEMGFVSEKDKGTQFWIEFSKKVRSEEKVVA